MTPDSILQILNKLLTVAASPGGLAAFEKLFPTTTIQQLDAAVASLPTASDPDKPKEK